MLTRDKTLTRRSLLRSAAAGALGLAAAGVVAGVPSEAGAQEVIASAVGSFRTTAALNLRSQPSTSAPVLLVIPFQANVTAIGPEENGFIKVIYADRTGWAHGDYLTVTSNDGGDTPAYLGTGKTTAGVNMRSGAGLNYGVLLVIPASATVELYDDFRNNYRLVRYGGKFGWVSANYISAGTPGSGQLTTTANLNLRAQPSLSGSILKVIPAGTTVSATNEIQNGYRKVTYAGTTGWASVAFLN